MIPILDLAEGAEDNPLAARLFEAIREGVTESPEKRADLKAMRGAVLVVAKDATLAATLRFDHGRLTLHDGAVGVPTITICGDLDVLMRLPDLPSSRLLRLPVALGPGAKGADALALVLSRLWQGELKLYGTLSHPRLWLRLARLLARRR